MRKRLTGLALALPTALAVGWGFLRAQVSVAGPDDPVPTQERANDASAIKPEASPSAWTTAVTPKPLSGKVRNGLGWLVEHQHPNGGWSQGEESPQMRGSGAQFRDTPDVADTCIAALALIRSGSTPREGIYKDAVAKAVRFVRAQVEDSDTASLSVSDVKGTRIQMKLGPNIDTFLASLFLAEVKGRMPDETDNKLVDLALDKVLDKIRWNQKADGSWDNRTGWAPILAQSMGGKGLNRAAQAGAAVPVTVLERAEGFAVAQADRTNRGPEVASPRAAGSDARVLARADIPASSSERGRLGPHFSTKYRATAGMMGGAGGGMGGMSGSAGFSGSADYARFSGSAGVELYDRASSLGVLQDSVNTNASFEHHLRRMAVDGKDEAQRDKARTALKRFEVAKKANSEARTALLGRLDDKSFVAGFGSNGGEEFLSYMNISESLVVKGGLDWTRWDDAMASNLGRVQNDDGSWTGHHCITGRTFCTSTALLVLMADRTPVPVSAKLGGKSGDK